MTVLLLQFLADPHLSISHVNYSLDQVCIGMLKCFGVCCSPNLWIYIKYFFPEGIRAKKYILHVLLLDENCFKSVVYVASTCHLCAQEERANLVYKFSSVSSGPG